MGKSSLMGRIQHYAIQQGYQTVSINMRSAGSETFSCLDHFLYWFCSMITDELDEVDELGGVEGFDAYWKGSSVKTASVTSNQKCGRYFRRSLLPALNRPIVLCMDNVDQIFQYRAIATDFFGLLRSWHENAKIDAVWARLRLIITYSKEVYVPLDINRSPFNVGTQIDVPPFNVAQVAALVQRHGLRWSEAEIQQLVKLLGGQPYLIRLALYSIARKKMDLPQLLTVAATEEGIFGEVLRSHLLNLEENSELVAGMKQVIASQESVRIEVGNAFKLASMGLVRSQGNDVVPFCELYRQYFSDRLGID